MLLKGSTKEDAYAIEHKLFVQLCPDINVSILHKLGRLRSSERTD
jgi:hypothetical protein